MAEGDFNVKAIISAETSNFDKGLKNAQSSVSALSKSIDGISKMLKTAFSAIGITASVGAVVNFGKKAVGAADEANKRFNVLQNTIRATGASTWTSAEELDKMAKSYAESTNYAVSEVERMQSVLLGFRNITGDTFGEATDAILDMATVMGMDLTSAAQTVGKALDDPIKGLDSLRRQGFQFTDEQKEELEILVKNGKQLEAQKIILDELATTYGGAAKAGQSAFAKLQHQMDQFRENIGNKLMPVVNMIMEQMSKSMEKVSQIIDNMDLNRIVGIIINIANKIKSVLDSIVRYFTETLNNIKDATKSIDFSPLISILETVIGVLKKLVEETKNRIDETVKMFTRLRDGISNVIDLKKIVAIVNTAIDVFWFLRDQIIDISNSIRDLINQTISKIWNSIKNIFQKSNDALAENEKGFASWGEFIWEQVNDVFRIFQDLFGMISQLIKGNWTAAWEYAKLAFMRMADTVLNLFSQIANAFPKLVNKVIDGVNVLIGGINKVREFFGDDPLGLIDSFASVDLSESTGLNAKIEEAERKIAELTGKQADYTIDEIKRISVASKGLVTNLIDDVTDTTDLVISSSNKATHAVISNYDIETAAASEKYQELTKLIKTFSKLFKDAFGSAFGDTFKMLGENLVGAGHSFQNFAAVSVKALSSVLESIGKQLAAIAILKFTIGDYVNAAIASVGAVASFVASGVTSELAGVLEDVAKKSKETSNDIDGIGKAANNANGSLEKFKKNLNDILNGVTHTSKNLMSNIHQLQDEFKKAEQASERAEDKYYDYVNSIADEYNYLIDVYNRTRIYTGNTSEWYRHQMAEKDIKEYQKQMVSYFIDIKKAEAAMVYAQMAIEKAIKDTQASLNEALEENKATIESYKDLYAIAKGNDIYWNILKSEQKINLQKLAVDLYDELTKSGEKLGSAFTNAFVDGSTKSDFLKQMKDYFRENLIKLAIYTESFQDQLSEIGTKLSTALVMGDTASLKNVKKQLSDLWDSTEKKIKGVEKTIESIFGDLGETVSELTENLGEDITDSITDGLVSGLEKMDEAEFLSSMKNYIRKLIVQTVVYTEAMKSEIESIGRTISKGISEGFTENSINELRRDLSYIFHTASNAMNGVNGLLDTVFGYATGTQAAQSGLAMVGEAGPELVRFRGGEQVLNTKNTQKALEGVGGTTVNQSITFNNLADTTAYAMMMQLKQYNRQMSINGVI